MTPLAVDLSVVKKIKKLLALTSSKNQFESEVAMTKASEMLDQYNLTAAEIAGINLVEEGVGIGGVIHKEHVVKMGSRQPFRWAFNLASAIGDSMYVKVLCYYKWRTLVLIGRETDIDVCIETFDWLYQQLYEAAQVASRDQTEPKVHATRFRNSYLVGAVRQVEIRLHDNKIARESANVKVTALARCSDQENQAYIGQTWGKVKSRMWGMGRRHVAGASQQGFQEAEKINLKRPNAGIKSEPMKELAGCR